MAWNPKKKRRAKPRSRASRRGAESRGVEALTVFWMLTALATLLALVAGGAATLLVPAIDDAGQPPSRWAAVPGVMLLTALATGTLCLMLTPLAVLLRRHKPPCGITWAAAAIGAAPWLIVAVRALGGR